MNIELKIKGWSGGWRRVYLAAAVLTVYACSQTSSEDGYLIRVGGSVVTVAEFKLAVEANSEESFQGDGAVSSSTLNEMYMRVLNQLSDTLIISERAKQLDIEVSERELEDSIAAVKADYPDDTFEKTLLENAVSFHVWKKKMATRILIDKVISKELKDKVDITTDDVVVYFKKHFPNGIPDGEDADQINKRIIQHLRQQKAEGFYQDWIESLRKEFPVDVHQKRWNRLVEANAE